MKIKFLLVFACLVVSLSLLLTACGNSSTTQTTSSTSTTMTTSHVSSSTSTSTASTTHSTVTTTTSTGTTGSLIDILGLGKNIDSIKFDIIVTVTGQAPVQMTVYQKQQKMREEVTMEGITTAIIFDVTTNVMYTYISSMNMAYKTTLDTSMVPESPTEDMSDILDYGANIIGTETIDGKVCKVVAYEEAGVGSVKMWLWEEKGLPLKMEMTAPSGEKTTIEYSNIDLSNIPDSMFEIPAGTTIIET